MIELQVKDYCQACMDFEPDVEKPTRMYGTDGSVIQTSTIVRCEYRRRCEHIKRHLEKQVKENENASLSEKTC